MFTDTVIINTNTYLSACYMFHRHYISHACYRKKSLFILCFRNRLALKPYLCFLLTRIEDLYGYLYYRRLYQLRSV